MTTAFLFFVLIIPCRFQNLIVLFAGSACWNIDSCQYALPLNRPHIIMPNCKSFIFSIRACPPSVRLTRMQRVLTEDKVSRTHILFVSRLFYVNLCIAEGSGTPRSSEWPVSVNQIDYILCPGLFGAQQGTNSETLS